MQQLTGDKGRQLLNPAHTFVYMTKTMQFKPYIHIYMKFSFGYSAPLNGFFSAENTLLQSSNK
jgi:hypothetical protein